MRQGTIVRNLLPAISLSFAPSFWSSALGTEFRAVLSSWQARGWISNRFPADEAVAPVGLTIEPKVGTDLCAALVPEAQAPDPDLLISQRSLLARVLAFPRTRVVLTSSSYIGAADVKLVADTMSEAGAQPRGITRSITALASPELVWLNAQIEDWNSRGPTSRADQLRFLASIRRAAEVTALPEGGVDLVLDNHLKDFDIQTPKRIALRWEERGARRQGYSICADAIHEDGRREPIPLSELDSDQPIVGMGEKRVLLVDSDAEMVLRSVRRKHQLRSIKQAAPAMADPALVIPEGISAENIDLSEYSSRVLGFVPIARASRPADIRSSGAQWFDDNHAPGPFLEMIVSPLEANAAPVQIRLDTPQDAEELLTSIQKALALGDPTPIQAGSVQIIPTAALGDRLAADLDAYRQLVRPKTTSSGPKEERTRLGVQLKEDASLERMQLPDAATSRSVPWADLESSLRPGVVLKGHQRDGIAWLWRQYLSNVPGVLLADEMGLGKTLQIACFLALQRALPHCHKRPALVVAPLLLLENWEDELARFLTPEAVGSVLMLHGSALSAIRGSDHRLDREEICRHSLVLTNYDTLERHQPSLLAIDWRAVVLDEAQYIKNGDTFRSRAARGLKRDFGICSTGTPVENRLADVWTLFDFLSPQSPFRSRTEFVASYPDRDAGSPASVARALQYPSFDSKVLRREKDRVIDLPPKSFAVHLAEMTQEQMRLEQLIAAPRADASEKAIFEILNQLRALYQHPWLLRSRLFGERDDDEPPDLDAILAASPKLAKTLNVLEGIQRQREKVLIFTPWTNMQTLLVHVLRERFGLRRVHVVNGESNQRRQSMQYIRDFSQHEGFDVLLLSPLAAGAGLNITAANHVIHYGRWWNPAKEDQATDRAHRIGQTRPVTVHYPVLHHRGNPQGGFDVQLHSLVERKRSVASDFLSPNADVTARDVAAIIHPESEPEKT